MRHKTLFRRGGFTLIELLTVIAIIGILAAISIPVIGLVKKKANVAKSKSAFQQMCTAVEQYKSAYGQYPFINGQYESKNDTFIQLNSTTAVSDFVKCLSGRQPIWDGAAALSTSDGKKFNRQGTQFYTFSSDVIQVDDTGNYTKLLTDAFGNTKLRLLMDTDGNGLVKPTDITGTPADYGIDTNGYINRRVIVYTLKSDNPTDYEDILSWQ